MTDKTCSKCGVSKSLEQFPRDARARDGHTARCKGCDSEQARTYYARNRARLLEHYRTTYANDPEVKRERAGRHAETRKLANAATYAVQRALKSGALVKPDTCEECGGGDYEITAAHRDYEPPYLNIRWLCRSCHMRWDRAQPKLARQREHDMRETSDE